MTGRKRRKNGAVARTALSLLGLGLGSAVFGALVVGPAIGKKVAQNNTPGRPTAPPTGADRERLLRDAFGLHSGDRSAESTGSTEAGSSRVRLSSTERPSRRQDTSQERAPVDPAERDAADAGTSADSSRGKRPTAAAEAPTGTSESETGRPKSTAHREETASKEEVAPRARAERASDRNSRRAAASEEPSTRAIVAEPAEPRSASVAELRHSDRRTAHDDVTAPARKHDGEVRLADTSTKASNADAEPEGAKLYRVRVGKFESRDDAEKLRDELKQTAGVTAFLVKVPDGYRVQTGAYKHRSNAEKIAGSLRSHSYRPQVTQE